jgi:hypothetical protein
MSQLVERLERGVRGATKVRRPDASFPDVVRAHHAWQSAVEGNGSARHAEERYRTALDAFEAEHGRIDEVYWCSSEPSAAALTVRPRRYRRPEIRFHRASDWATKGDPDVAGPLHQCDALAVRIVEVLRGKTQRIGLQLVMAAAAHLLSLVDERTRHDKDERRAVLKQSLAEVDGIRRYYQNAANGDAQIVYSFGMLAGVAALVVASLFLGGVLNVAGIDDAEFFGCMTAGALGAVVSVMARISSGRMSLHYDVGRGDLLFLGGIRPLLGAIFGLAMYFAVISGILDLFSIESDDGTKRLYFLLVIAFLAGFSERWAKDVLDGVGASLAPTEREPEPPAQR